MRVDSSGGGGGPRGQSGTSRLDPRGTDAWRGFLVDCVCKSLNHFLGFWFWVKGPGLRVEGRGGPRDRSGRGRPGPRGKDACRAFLVLCFCRRQQRRVAIGPPLDLSFTRDFTREA